MARGTKATKRGQVVDPVSQLRTHPEMASNQLRVSPQKQRVVGTQLVGNVVRVGGNPNGTNKTGVSATMANANARKIGIKMPANF